MTNKLSVGALVIALAALGVAYFAPSKLVVQQTKDTEETITRIVEEALRKLGAISGPSISGDSSTVGGLREVSIRSELRQGTSTICALPAPVGSSTPLYFAVQLDSGYATSNSQVVVDLFISSEDRSTTTAFASTTANIIGSPYRPHAFNGATIVAWPSATTTGVDGEEMFVASTTGRTTSFGPMDLNGGSRFDFLVAKLNAPAAGDYTDLAPVGGCYAKFLVHDNK